MSSNSTNIQFREDDLSYEDVIDKEFVRNLEKEEPSDEAKMDSNNHQLIEAEAVVVPQQEESRKISLDTNEEKKMDLTNSPIQKSFVAIIPSHPVQNDSLLSEVDQKIDDTTPDNPPTVYKTTAVFQLKTTDVPIYCAKNINEDGSADKYDISNEIDDVTSTPPSSPITRVHSIADGNMEASVASIASICAVDPIEKTLASPNLPTGAIVAPDGGYGWIIVLISFLSNFVVDGICNSFSEFKPSFSKNFSTSDSLTTLIGSMLIGVYLLVGPLVAIGLNRYGARRIAIIGCLIGSFAIGVSPLLPSNFVAFILLYSILGGLGLGAIYLPGTVEVGLYFEKKRAIATGMAVAGSGVGTIVMPLLSEYLISNHDCDFALACLGLIVFCLSFIVTFYRPLKSKVYPVVERNHELEPLVFHSEKEHIDSRLSADEESPSTRGSSPRQSSPVSIERPTHLFRQELQHEKSDLSLYKNPVMMLLCLSNLCAMMGFYIPFIFLKDLASFSSIPTENSKFLVPIIGVTNTIGRIIFGWLADRGWFTVLFINNFALLICGLLTAAAPMLISFELLVVYAASFGFFISAYISLTSIVLIDLLGIKNLSNSFGLLIVARGVASLIGAPFAGFVYDITGSYGAAFFLAGGVIVLAGVFSVVVSFVHGKKTDQDMEIARNSTT